MNDTPFPSGGWTGFYRYGWILLKRKGPMELQLSFEDGLIKGSGSDPVGDFEIVGNYRLESQDYQWAKRYRGKHSVLYQGKPSGNGLAGRWNIPHNWSGDFKIWPSGNPPLEDESLLSQAHLLGLPCP